MTDPDLGSAPSGEDVELVPPGAKLRIYRHDFKKSPDSETVPCWSYFSHNLSDVGQQEVMLTLRWDDEDHKQGLLPDLLEIFKLLYELAREGQRVGVGQFTELGRTGLLGRADLRGIGYLPAQPLPGMDEEIDGRLQLLLLTEQELAVAKTAGVYRVAARLGQAESFYPYPPYNDRRREAVAQEGEESESLISSFPSVWIGGTTASKRDGTVTLTLPRASLERLQQLLARLAPQMPLCLLAFPDPAATAALVWRPGQTAAQAYSPPGAEPDLRLGGNFCAFVPQQDADGGQLLEDGFAFPLTDETWQRLREALRTGEPFATEPEEPDALAACLRWR